MSTISDEARARLAQLARERHARGELDAKSNGAQGGIASGEVRRDRQAEAARAMAVVDAKGKEQLADELMETLDKITSSEYLSLKLAGAVGEDADLMRRLTGIEHVPVVDQRRFHQ